MYDNTTKKICPICGKRYTQFPALSRYDDKTHVCPDCGVVEAFNGGTILTARKLHLDFTAYAHLMNRKEMRSPLVKAILKISKDGAKMLKNMPKDL